MEIKQIVKEGNNQSSVTITDNSIEIKLQDEIKVIEEDIIGIKSNMNKAIRNNDANLYGKWMNNYRNALQLREELKNKKESNKKDIITNLNINIAGFNAENINNEKIQEIADVLVKRKVSMR